jgi:hypothetical protein
MAEAERSSIHHPIYLAAALVDFLRPLIVIYEQAGVMR